MADSIPIPEFLEVSRTTPVLDVRSPSEYLRGHIPGAISLPLFTDEERHIVGKTYHLRGREEAVAEGLKAVGPKMRYFVEEALTSAPGKRVLAYCWRGGMRSASFGFLLETAGMKVKVLQGGYKSYRRHVLTGFQLPYRLVVLGGMTGSGKTEMLRHLRQAGEQVIDLEALASHKGSAFGHLGQEDQPCTEHFENLLFRVLSDLDPSRPCWVEDESMTIGNVHMPRSLYMTMKASPLVMIDMPRALRAQRLTAEYPKDLPGLVAAVEGLRKRLGNDRAQHIIRLLQEGNLVHPAMLLLEYYDKAYQYSLKQRDPGSIRLFRTECPDPEINTVKLIQWINTSERI